MAMAAVWEDPGARSCRGGHRVLLIETNTSMAVVQVVVEVVWTGQEEVSDPGTGCKFKSPQNHQVVQNCEFRTSAGMGRGRVGPVAGMYREGFRDGGRGRGFVDREELYDGR